VSPRSLIPFALLLAGCAAEREPVVTTIHQPYGKPVTITEIADLRIDEASGIAPSLTEEGVYYTHNDSGHGPYLYKFNLQGEVLGEYRVKNADAKDWEDIASARVDGKPYLFVGDIGDNNGIRKWITVYRVPEPEGKRGRIKADARYQLEYPDEPHNAETLMVHPTTGDLYIVTKAANRPSMVFRLPKPEGSGRFTLTKIGEVQFDGVIREARTVTGGAISPDARHVVLRTYLQAEEFDAPENFDDWVKAAPRKVKVNFDLQGEGITYSPSGDAFVTSSELTPCKISKISIDR